MSFLENLPWILLEQIVMNAVKHIEAYEIESYK